MRSSTSRLLGVTVAALLGYGTVSLGACGSGADSDGDATLSISSEATFRCTSPSVDPTTPNAPVAQWIRSDHALTSDHVSPYMTARFVQKRSSFMFDQAPSWTRDGRVLANPNGDRTRIYNTKLDGTDRRCLTCSHPNNTNNGLPAQNGLAQEQPQGNWILFESTRGQILNLGGSGLGGLGDALWVMRPDGSCPVQLTGIGIAGELANDFHAYWSPDGKKIVWTRISANLLVDDLDSGTSFTMRLADFVDDGINPPHLENVIILAPRAENYETQPWAPDGSGFLFQYSDAGQNQEVYYMRLFGQGATPLRPYVQKVTDGRPSWEEQAVFTKDMSAVIFMSSRDCPTCIYNAQTTLLTLLGVPQLPLGLDGVVYIPVFFGAVVTASLLPPTLGGFKTDLYVMDLYSKQIRRLTNDNGIIPEFYFDSRGKNLIWSENHVYGSLNIPGLYTNNTMTAYFEGLP